MNTLRKTKIVCTIGPASNKREVLKEIILAGMDVARLNFSHGTYEEHKKVIRLIRELCYETGRSVAILQDLCGPKIRVGSIPAGVILKSGELFTFTGEECAGTATKAHISYSNLSKEVVPGTKIFIDDGLLRLVVEKVEGAEVICRVITGGPLSSKKGVNFPGTELKIPALTEKDKEDLAFGLEQNVDWIALSFVQRPSDIVEIKDIIRKAGKSTPVIAKIEKGEALKQLSKIIDITDGLMVARGDLSVETPVEKLPLEQKNMISLCRKKGKPVITATQMMDSMIRNPRPTNAEVTDVANAILDGTDAVMLSGETASGAYPVEAVKTMALIAATAEIAMPYEKVLTEEAAEKRILEVISRSACEMSEELKASAIIVSTSSGRSARKISLYRPRAPVIALTEDEVIARQLKLSWGVFPVIIGNYNDTDSFIKESAKAAISTGLVKDGDLIVISAGYPIGGTGSTNTLQIQVLGHIFLRGKSLGKSKEKEGKLLILQDIKDLKKIEQDKILAVPCYSQELLEKLPSLAGLVVADENLSPDEEVLLAGAGIPVLVGVPGVFTAFSSGDSVKIDVKRGIIYK
ncbi:MAG: pyruvate kinase [Candidatus Eremiobacterota bacterium]